MSLARHRTPSTVAQATPRLAQTSAVVAVPDPNPNRAATALAGVDFCGSLEAQPPSAAPALAASTPLTSPTSLAGRWQR